MRSLPQPPAVSGPASDRDAATRSRNRPDGSFVDLTSPATPITRPGRSAAVWGGLLVSVVLHAVALTVLAFVTFLTPSMPSMVTLDAGLIEEPSQVFEADDWMQRPSVFRSDGRSNGGGSKGNSLHLPVTSAAVLPNFDAVASIDAPLSDVATEGPINLGARVAEKASGVGNGNGAGIGNGTGNGVGDGNGYFGMKADRKSIVFVVDASNSMNHPYPGIARTRFGRVKLELFKTISQMTEEQKFFVIFFAEDALPMPARNLVSATPENQKLAMEWIGGIRTFGNTEPQNAVVMALKLKPDVIYFLTDGNFDRDTVKSAKRHNPTKIPIHTIGFGDNTGEVRMKEIAELTGGTYRFIPEEQPTQQAAAPEPDKTAKP